MTILCPDGWASARPPRPPLFDTSIAAHVFPRFAAVGLFSLPAAAAQTAAPAATAAHAHTHTHSQQYRKLDEDLLLKKRTLNLQNLAFGLCNSLCSPLSVIVFLRSDFSRFPALQNFSRVPLELCLASLFSSSLYVLCSHFTLSLSPCLYYFRRGQAR